MANTYTKIYIQVVFAVKARQGMLQSPWKEEVFRYMSTIIDNKGHKSIIVNGPSDHVHLFIGLRPSMAISDLVRDIKNNSSKFINQMGIVRGRFEWQNGFGAFSYSPSHIGRVYQYIKNQESHHNKKTFREEYLEILKKSEIDFDSNYLFEFLEK